MITKKVVILISTSKPNNLIIYLKKIQFLLLLESLIGEQKIDVVFHRDGTRPIEQEAKNKGIQLNTDTLMIEKYLNECDKHILRIEQAYKSIFEELYTIFADLSDAKTISGVICVMQIFSLHCFITSVL